MPRNPLLKYLWTAFKKLGLLKVRWGFFLLWSKSPLARTFHPYVGNSDLISSFGGAHWSGNLVSLEAPSLLGCEDMFSLILPSSANFLLLCVVTSLKGWKLPLLVPPACNIRASWEEHQKQEGLGVSWLVFWGSLWEHLLSQVTRKSREYFLYSDMSKLLIKSPLSRLKYPSYIQLQEHWWTGNFSGEV